VLTDLYHHRAVEGGSTLTQQLIKVVYMNNDDDGWRKPENLVLALKLESKFDKHTILENYLNAVYYGHGAYGIGEASAVYFHRPPAKLDLARASMLAGLPQSPSYYDLYRNPCAARARQFNVLAQMAHDGYIREEQAATAYSEPIGFRC
jgi:membrane peptidoglycan carboxypeptidase